MMACVVIWWREPLHWLHYHQIEKEGRLRSEITMLEAPMILSPHESGQCKLEVKNLGTTTWTSGDGFKLGGFERDWKGNRVEPPRLGPARIEVPQDISSNSTWQISFALRAPAKPGKYKLHLQMVQENATWFGEEVTIKVRAH